MTARKESRRRDSSTTRLTDEVLYAALRAAAPLRRRRNVLGLSIGMRQRCGEWIADEPCIAIRVAEKVPLSDLRRHQVFPSTIDVKVRGRRYRVPVDVRSARGATAGQCFGHISSIIEVPVSGDAIGAVSACVITTTEPKLLISGHVARHRGRSLIVNGMPVTTETPRMTKRLDHCLATCDFELDDASLPDGTPFSGLRDSSTIARGDVLHVYRACPPGRGDRLDVVVRDTNADAVFEYPDGFTRVFGLIVVDDVCQRGDSGSPLFDDDFNLVGTLLGGVGEDYYIPADFAFDQLGIALP